MIKNTLILIFLLVFVVVSFSLIKGESFSHLFIEDLLESRKEKIEVFLEDKKESINEEIDAGKEDVKKTLQEKGLEIWEKIGNFIFRKETDIDNEG
jgi:hypothetical protein